MKKSNIKKKHRPIIVIMTVLALAVLIPVGQYIWHYYIANYSIYITLNWGFSLPLTAKCELLYVTDSGPSFHGDGIRYRIYSYENEEAITKKFSWTTPEEAERYNTSDFRVADEWLDEINVPDAERPNYTECYYWYHSDNNYDEMILYLDSDHDKLYVIESFI